ncbi:MAG: 3-deoxy-8-phosphooctulonate synthase [Elusimicrobiales bacterium]
MTANIRQTKVKIGGAEFCNAGPLAFIAGPCVIESEQGYLSAAKKLAEIFRAARRSFVLKASFDKANRTSVKSFRGPGMARGLEILAKAKKLTGAPLLVDVHEPPQAVEIAKVADILQIPAFLCRQTDLVLACARTGKAVNVKKGQFLAPWDMGNIAAKIESAGNRNIMFTERGTSFGYGRLVVDMSGLEVMKRTGYPVIFDATHSVQQPGALGSATGGDSSLIPALARAAAAVGVAGLFFEAHQDPRRALSDGPNSLSLKDVPKLVRIVCKLDDEVKKT